MSLIDPLDSVSASPVVQQTQNQSSSGDTDFSALLPQLEEPDDEALMREALGLAFFFALPTLVEEVDDEAPAEQALGLPMCRILTDEEEKRLAELQDQLRQCLMDMVDNPSDETRRRIREIEEEIEELTGIKTKHKLAKTVKNLPLEDDEDEDERQARPMSGELAEELGIRPVPSDLPDSDPGIMDFYEQNLAAFLNKDIIYKDIIYK